MDGRLIFLHRLPRFDPFTRVSPRQIPRLDVGVGARATAHLEAALLPKSVEEGPRRA
jgi:hypothetical protein